MEKSSIAPKKVPSVLRVAPGLQNLLGYRRPWLRKMQWQGLWLFDEVARDRAFAPGVYSKAAADPFAHARRGRADNRGDAGRQAVAAEVAGALTGGGICSGAGLQRGPGRERGRGRGPGAAGITAVAVA